MFTSKAELLKALKVCHLKYSRLGTDKMLLRVADDLWSEVEPKVEPEKTKDKGRQSK